MLICYVVIKKRRGKNIVHSNTNYRISFIEKQANQVAHCLARASRLFSSSKILNFIPFLTLSWCFCTLCVRSLNSSQYKCTTYIKGHCLHHYVVNPYILPLFLSEQDNVRATRLVTRLMTSILSFQQHNYMCYWLCSFVEAVGKDSQPLQSVNAG